MSPAHDTELSIIARAHAFAAQLRSAAENLPQFLVEVSRLPSLSHHDRGVLIRAVRIVADAVRLVVAQDVGAQVALVWGVDGEGYVRRGIALTGGEGPEYRDFTAVYLPDSEVDDLLQCLTETAEGRERGELDDWIERSTSAADIYLLFARLDLDKLAAALQVLARGVRGAQGHGQEQGRGDSGVSGR